MKNLRILLLGPPEVHHTGCSVVIQRRVTRAMLYYLASREGKVGRDELLSLFWEEDSEEIARRRLRETLSRLRAALPQPNLLLTESGNVSLDFNQVYVDLREFYDLIDQAGRIPWQIPADKPLPEHISSLLHQAVTLWRSPHFMAGANFPSTLGIDDWLTRTGQILEHQYGRVLERLSDHAHATGNLEEAQRLARLALLTDELNEDLHYRVLRSMIEMNHRSQARHYFTYLQNLLRNELDTGPAPRLVDLYRRVREEDSPIQHQKTKPSWNLRPSVLAPFVGREQVLEQLHQSLYSGGGMIIFGESGQGKTRLLQEFTKNIETEPRLLLTVCHPAENNLLFQPIVELLRHQIQPDEWLELAPVWASQLTLLLPDLAIMRPDLERPSVEFAPEIAPGQARSQLLEALHQVFLLIACKKRVLFCLDDAQWADEATLAAVAYLLQRPPFDEHALLVVAARREEVNPHLEVMLEQLYPAHYIRLIHLTQLNLEEIAALARHVLGYTPLDQFIQQLASESGGNPLFVLETLRAIIESSSRLDLSNTEKLPLTESIQTLIHARLKLLNPQERAVLEIAAVVGIEFDPEVVGAVCGLGDAEIVSILEDLHQRLLIEPLSRSAEDVRHRFIHSKFREVLLQEINPMRVRYLHGRIANVLEGQGSMLTNQAAVLARHFESAGVADKAFVYWVRAGQRARQLFSVADAVAAFSRAEQAIEHAPGLTEDQIHSLYAEWSELAYEMDDASTIQQINTTLLGLGRERSSSLLIGAALNGLSHVGMISNRFEEGLLYANQAIPYLEQSHNLYEHMEAYNHRGVFLYMLNRLEEAVESFQDALALGAGSCDLQVLRARANAHYQISFAHTLGGWPAKGLNHGLRSLSDFNTLNRAHGQVTAYSALALSRYFLGDFQQSRQDCLQGIELARRIQSWRMLGYLHGYLAMVELAQGKLDQAFENAGITIQLGERHGHNEMAAGGYRIWGDIFYWLGVPQTAVNHYQCGLEASKDKFLAVDNLYRLGLNLSLMEQVEVGKQYIEQAIVVAQSTGLGFIQIMAQLAEGVVYKSLGDWQKAGEIAALVQEEALKRSMRFLRLSGACLHGQVALQNGSTSQAVQLFRSIIQEAEALPHPWIELVAQTGLDQALQSTGLVDPAPRQRILQLLDRIEANAQAEAVKQAFLDFRQRALGE